jgi:integrase
VKAKVIELEIPGVIPKRRMVIVPGPVTEPEPRVRAGRPSRSRRARSARTSRAATESNEAPASPDGDSPAPSPPREARSARPASHREPAREKMGHGGRAGRNPWTAPAGRGMRFMAARNFGKVREVKARGVWEIDVRPYGRFRSIPVQGAKPILLTSCEMAESVLAQIRAEVQAGKSEWAAVAPYLPRALSTIDKVVKRWCDEMSRRIEAKEIAPRTLKRIESYAQPDGHFSWLYEFSVYEVTPGHLSDWNLWLMQRGLHQNTRKHVVETMRTLFRWLHARGELEAVPRFPTVAKRKHVPNVIAPDEQERVLAAIPEQERGIYIMAVEEVFRPGELRALNVSDYDFKTHTVTLRQAMDGDTNAAERKCTKEEDVRVREVTDRMAEWIESNVPPQERLKGTRPLFVNPDGRLSPGRPLQRAGAAPRLEARRESRGAEARPHVRGHEAQHPHRGPQAGTPSRPATEGRRPQGRPQHRDLRGAFAGAGHPGAPARAPAALGPRWRSDTVRCRGTLIRHRFGNTPRVVSQVSDLKRLLVGVVGFEPTTLTSQRSGSGR